ncbi:hypothetical protein BpHYR1_009371 [Brachionus plicatilis]|uniref:Uncharacterized protein n=1 Tax=Brachionus plicatilis TaxID=10195 RepID=A0A3M7QA74_BRAPC|nr:hypothetical protein BpHYR1_009371 [Brachionus plicatilis]
MKNSCNKFPFNEPVFVEPVVEPVIKKRSEKTWKKRGRKRKQICEIEEENQMIQPPAKITNVEFNARLVIETCEANLKKCFNSTYTDKILEIFLFLGFGKYSSRKILNKYKYSAPLKYLKLKKSKT